MRNSGRYGTPATCTRAYSPPRSSPCARARRGALPRELRGRSALGTLDTIARCSPRSPRLPARNQKPATRANKRSRRRARIPPTAPWFVGSWTPCRYRTAAPVPGPWRGAHREGIDTRLRCDMSLPIVRSICMLFVVRRVWWDSRTAIERRATSCCSGMVVVVVAWQLKMFPKQSSPHFPLVAVEQSHVRSS